MTLNPVERPLVLATAVVHDVKNRIAVLTQELLGIEESSQDAAALRHIGNAKAQSGAILRSLTNFLVGTQVEQASLRCRSEPESINELLLEVKERAEVFMPEHLTLEVFLGGAPVTWFFDRNMLQLAIDAGIDNAARYARTRIRLSASTAPNGGVSFIVENDSKEAPTGGHSYWASSTGLGLKIAKAIAAGHQNKGAAGTVELDIGKARTLFTVTIP